MNDGSQNGTPSFAELAAALAAIRPPAQSEPQGIARHVGTILVAAVIGMGVWMTSTISSLQNTLTSVSTTVQAISKTLGDVQVAQTGSVAAIGDIKAQNAGLAQRVASLETNLQRMNDRMRIVEGQKPLDRPRDE